MTGDENHLPGVIERSVENLSAVLRTLLPGGTLRGLHAGPVDALVAFVLLLAVEAFVFAITVSPEAVSYWEMRNFAGAVVFHILVVALVALVLRRGHDLNWIVTGLLWAMILGLVLALVVSLAVDTGSLAGWTLGYAVPSLLPAVLLLLTALGLWGGLAASVGLIASVAVIVLEWSGFSLWTQNEDVVEGPPLADTEAVYSAQSELLASQASGLRTGDPATPELFALLGAGYPLEKVFQREVEAVTELLEADFDARDRVMRLVNSWHAPTAYPLLNRTNLTSALSTIGQKMDNDDILLLFLSSHGGPEILSTEFAGVMTRDLSPAHIAEALASSGIKYAVVIISACYSGSFVDALKAPSRLVLTAARSDRASFGCSDKAEWTNWGRAFFVEALDETRDLREAALIARDLVAKWEADEGFEASDPQIVEGALIGSVLDRWLATFD